MPQNTLLFALGTFLPGSVVSAAAKPTPSVPWNENPATKNTISTEVKPPTKGACVADLGSARVQFCKPAWPPSMPVMVNAPTDKKMMTVTTLMLANQYSASAYALTDSRLSPISSEKNPMAHSVEFELGNQNCTTREPATNSAARVMAQLNQ